jgi:DNA-binding transcriptional LysR family regulator
MPRVIARYHQQFPRIKVKVLDSSAHDVLGAVVNGEADFGLSFMGTLEAEVEFEPLVQEEYVVACRRDHPLAGRSSVTWDEFYQQDYISLDKTSGNRFLLDQALVGIVPQRPSICQTRHVTTMIGLVEAGLGVAAVPLMAMPAADHPILTRVPLTNPQVMRSVGLIKRRGRTLTPAALELERLVVEMKVQPSAVSG